MALPDRNGQVVVQMGGIPIKAILTWFTRVMGIVLAAGILWLSKLILVAVMYLVNTLPPMQADVNSLKNDVKSLKETAATKTELLNAEARVKNELSKEVAEQLKKAKTITSGR